MTDKTYTIKPLVWEQDERCASIPFNNILDVYVTRNTRMTRRGKCELLGWLWYVCAPGIFQPIVEGECESMKAAKDAAEFAYRAVLERLLEAKP